MMTSKNAWLAVNLSMWFPGLGQMYAGETGRGMTIVIAQIFLIGYGFWHCITVSGNTIIGLFLLFGALIVHVMGLIDNYERMPDASSQKTSPWKFAFLSQTLPGLGQAYQRNWLWGVFFFLAWNASFHLCRGWMAIVASAWIAAVSAGHALFAARPNPAKTDRRLIAFLSGIFIVWSLRLGVPYTINQQVLKTYYIPSESMEPVLNIGDRILVRQCGIDGLQSGDVVVFHAQDKPGDVYVKRLIALSGDTVQIASSRLVINSRTPDNPILRGHEYTQMGHFGINGAYIIPKRKVFFLGDNSPVSIDSRFFGAVAEQAVIGRAYKIIWPPGRIGPIR